jgi:hypothetical protein
MTYGQLLRKLASLSEYQLKQEVSIILCSSRTRYDIERICIWDDGNEENDRADVEIQIGTDG